MAYFPNGTSGMIFDEQCAECIHEDPEALCPIAYIQMEFNYSQNRKGNEELRKAMNILVSEDGQCAMKPLIDKLLNKGQRPKQPPHPKAVEAYNRFVKSARKA